MSAVIDGLAINGRLLVEGASADPIAVFPQQLIRERRSIKGWPSGAAIDSQDALAFSALSGVLGQQKRLRRFSARLKLMSG